MQYPISVPRTADGALKVSVLRWMKSVGEDVIKGEDLAEVKTEKISLYVTAPESGKLTEILAQPGVVVPVGEVIGYVTG
ncbi:MAG TPA: biotin/lipoyl-containing protein [Anaerolineales bacterium]|nr:biotin/lipoyl-containing protein [Anaerolineales bacterium]